ncbi:amidohydrolase family protein [Qipengyuania xiapuensis]|uniref:Amidohydrolase family protein n=1 Tax=Qipengyuania xiapuensis TaxID=2867236 RepID=A0ABX8ZR53_9SPHN|nr:amidohydrolase family protein [Qipengyuania xiapuensis]QZD91496.1 amidohydrolase family protein [Qipengyuania xiapuensis]
MKRLLTLAASALALAATPAVAQTMAITGVNVAKGDGSEPIENGAVVVENGKVTYAGPASGMPEVAMPLVEAPPGTWVTPGLFATVTTLGLWDVGAVSESNDTRAGDSPFNAALDVSRAINPDSQHIKIHRAAGVTRAATLMGSTGSIFGGQGALIDLGADPDPVTEARAFQIVQLGEAGARLAGGSRVASYAEFANALREAREAANGRWDAESAMLTRADAEALVPVVTGRQKLYVMVERAADIRGVLDLKREYRALDLVLVGASEGWMVAPEIAAAGVPVIADGLDDLPSSFEQLGSTQSNIGRMVAAGVKVGINASAMENPRNLNQYAGNLVALTRIPGADGLSWGQAFAAISSVPAEISGLGGRAGVLAPGAAGDIVVWDGDPLEVGSVPMQVYIDGVAQPLENHQSRLRDRYRDLDESDLPKAYDW